MSLRAKELEQLKSELRDLPAPDRSNREVTATEAIREVAGEIELLRQRGYAFDEIREFLAARGVNTTVQSLKRRYYLARREARDPAAVAASTPRNRRRKRSAPPRANDAVNAPVNAPDLASRTGGEEAPPPAARPLEDRPPGRPGTFQPRPDHDDL